MVFFFFFTPYISLSLIKHVNLYFRCKFLRRRSGVAKKQLTLSTFDVFPRRAYWISGVVGDKHSRGIVSGNGDSMVFLRGEKIINVLCFINLKVRLERPSKISNFRPTTHDSDVGFRSWQEGCNNIYIYILYYSLLLFN